jgi:hypothetical protein
LVQWIGETYSRALKGVSETADIKRAIQNTVRDIVILRDGGCIMRESPHAPACNGYRNDGELVLQADHLITRTNSATYADTRLIVCVCKGHHGWKKWHVKEYDSLVSTLMSPERLTLWKAEAKDAYESAKEAQLKSLAMNDNAKVAKMSA